MENKKSIEGSENDRLVTERRQHVHSFAVRACCGLCGLVFTASVIGGVVFVRSDTFRDGAVASKYLAGDFPEINAIDRKIEQLSRRSQELASSGRAIDGTRLSLALREEYEGINRGISQLMQEKDRLLKERGYHAGK